MPRIPKNSTKFSLSHRPAVVSKQLATRTIIWRRLSSRSKFRTTWKDFWSTSATLSRSKTNFLLYPWGSRSTRYWTITSNRRLDRTEVRPTTGIHHFWKIQKNNCKKVFFSVFYTEMNVFSFFTKFHHSAEKVRWKLRKEFGNTSI